MKRIPAIVALVLIAAATFTLTAQRQEPPEGGQPKDFVLPAKTSFTLDNGLRVTLVPYGSIPTVTMTVAVRAGRLNETADRVWVSDLTGEMLKEGTASRGSEKLAKDFARIGGTLNVAVGVDRSAITGDALSEFSTDLVALLADVVRHPAFPEAELQRVKANLQRNISVLKSRPDQLANEKFRNVLYGDHPYGRPIPGESAIGGYAIGDVRSFFTANFGAQRTHIVVVGKFDPATVEKAVRKEFGDWSRGEQPIINVPKPVSRRGVHLLNRPGAPQSTIIMGLPVPDPSTPDYVALLVTNALLGGAFDSRITANIRENKGYTYSPYSTISTRYRDAYWAEMADVGTEVTGASLKEISFEINRLRETPPPADELKRIQNYQAGIFVLQNSSPSMMANLYLFLDLHGLPDEYLKNYVRNVHAVTPEKVQSVMRETFNDDRMTIVVVGDRARIASQVAPYGPVAN
jgi:predicted Zn-dependent peptidase